RPASVPHGVPVPDGAPLRRCILTAVLALERFFLAAPPLLPPVPLLSVDSHWMHPPFWQTRFAGPRRIEKAPRPHRPMRPRRQRESQDRAGECNLHSTAAPADGGRSDPSPGAGTTPLEQRRRLRSAGPLYEHRAYAFS